VEARAEDAPRPERVREDRPRRDARPPRDEARGPREDVRAPREDVRAPREDVRAPREDVRAPRDDARPPREAAGGPRRDSRPEREAPQSFEARREEFRREKREDREAGPTPRGFGDAVPAFMLLSVPKPRRDAASDAEAA
jgi:hypothetical protein